MLGLYLFIYFVFKQETEIDIEHLAENYTKLLAVSFRQLLLRYVHLPYYEIKTDQ